MCSAPSLGSLSKVVLETVPVCVWLNTDRSWPRRLECRLLPFSTPLSFRRSILWCSGLSMLRKFLKPLSTSALPSCRPANHRGLVVKHPPWEQQTQVWFQLSLWGFFPGQVIPMTQNVVLQSLPCHVPGDTGSALGLVSLVSVYWLAETVRLICNFYLSVAAHTIV